MARFIPSSRSGKTWSVSFFKPQGRPGYASAIEGEYEPYDGGHTFRFALFSAETRSFKKTVDGVCTAKKKAAAVEALIASLKEQGLLADAA